MNVNVLISIKIGHLSTKIGNILQNTPYFIKKFCFDQSIWNISFKGMLTGELSGFVSMISAM